MKTFIDGKENNLTIDNFFKTLKEGKKIYFDVGDDEDNERVNVRINVYDKDPTDGDKLVGGYEGEVHATEIIRFCTDFPRGLRKYDFEIERI